MEFRAFFEVASVGLVQIDPNDGRILRHNQKFNEITGYSSAELTELTVSALTHPDDRQSDWEIFSRAARGETPDYRNEKRYVRKDGSTVWVRLNASFIRGPDGRPYRTAAICEDISERKRAELALRESESFNVAVLNSIVDHIAVVDDLGRIIAVNDAWRRFADESDARPHHAHFVGQSYLEICAKARDDPLAPEAGPAASGLRAVLAGEKLEFNLDYACHAPNQERWFQLRITPLSGPRRGAIVSHSEISERKRVEAALRQSEELLQRIGAIAKIGAWELDLRTLKPHWSLETFHIHEVDPSADFAYDEALRFYPPEARMLVESAIRCAGEHGTAWDLEVPFITAKGRSLWVRVQGSVLMEDGVPVKLRGAIQDITAQKLLEADKERLAELNLHHQKSESLSRMAGAVAHHFNNQLQAVMGNIELVVGDLPSGSDAARGLFEAMDAARKAAEMSGLMLTYLGQQRATLQTLDLSDITAETLRRLREGQAPQIVVESALPSPGPAISANAKEIQGVITNLMVNAREAIGSKKGVVRVIVQTVPADGIPADNRLPIDWHPSASQYACIAISDTGCGIEPGVMEKIFDPFYSTKFVGRGLGLSIVLGTVRSLHGAITVESKPGSGTVFRIYLPLSSSIPRPRAVTSASPAQSSRAATILVVEDEPGVRVFTTVALSQSGHTVLAATDGAEAVRIFRQRADQIDCVVCDLTMPDMSGWETLTALRELKPGVPVILVSGHREEQVMAESNAERPQFFLQKPYGKRALCEAVQNVLS